MNRYSVLILFFATLAVTSISGQSRCRFPQRIRGKWVIMPRDRSNQDTGYYVIVRDDHIQVDLLVTANNITETQSSTLYCREIQDGRYHFLVQSLDQAKLLCLQFNQLMDTNVQYMMRRTNYADAGQGYFDPTVTALASPSIKNTCTVIQNVGIPLRRSFAGCSFPKVLQKTWNYTGSEFNSLMFTNSKVIVEASDGRTMEFQCERMDHPPTKEYHLIALRSINMKTVQGRKKDGLLCLRVNIGPQGQTNVQRFNSGTDMMNTVKVISRAEPIYLHESCDRVDAPLAGVDITEK